jgi:mannosyltransferase
MPRSAVAGVAALTLLGILARVAGIDQSLFGDELFTYYVTEPGGLGEVLDRVRDIESNPPLFSVLAWLFAQVGDATVWTRVPSLVAGCALIPLLALLGARLGGPRVGVTAAALVAASPFAVFFATEARGYAVLAFLLALSTFALLNAVDGGGRRWWAAFAIASVAALYTHYTAAFPLAAQAAWALWAHRERAREVVLAHAAVALAFAPWIPLIRENDAERAVGGAFDLTLGTAFTAPLRSVFGHPIESFGDLPGTAGGVLLALAALALAAGLAVRRAPLPREAVLIAALAVATPVGLLLYDALGGGDLYLPRNLSASLPALVVGLAWAAWSPPRAFAAAAAAALVLAAAVGTVRLVADDDHARPAFRAIAERIDERARPGDTVVSSPLFFIDPASPLHRGLEAQLDRDERLYFVTRAVPERGVPRGVADPRAWEVSPGGRVWVAGYEQPGTFLLPAPPPGARFRAVERRTYPGLTRLTLVVYEREP